MIETLLIILIFILLLFVFLPTDLMISILGTVFVIAPFLWINQAWSAYRKREQERIAHFNSPDKRDMVHTFLQTLLRGGIAGLIFAFFMIGLLIYDIFTGTQTIQNYRDLLHTLWIVAGFSICSGFIFWFSVAGFVRLAYRQKGINKRLGTYDQSQDN